MNGFQGVDYVGFTQGQNGPGGAGAVSLGAVGTGNVQSAGYPAALNATPEAAKVGGFSLSPVIWMFILLVGGYVGLHQSLKAV